MIVLVKVMIMEVKKVFFKSCLNYSLSFVSYPWGWVSDKVGRRPVLLWCNFLLALTTLAFGFAKSFEAALVIRFITGVIAGTLKFKGLSS